MSSPAGQQPVDDGEQQRGAEHYSPALALPTEPTVPSRRRPLYLALAALAMIAGIALVISKTVLPGQQQDPALTPLDGDGQLQTEPAPADPDGTGTPTG